MSDELTGRLAIILALAKRYVATPQAARREVAVEYLFEVGELLNGASGEDDILAPLLDLIPIVADPETQAAFDERRNGQAPPSDSMMVRVVATIDVLTENGHGNDQAAQLIARQLVRAGVSTPLEGGDARGWRRLQLWRERLFNLKTSSPHWPRYLEFKAQIATQSRQSLLSAALDGTLWNRRIKQPA